MSLPAAVGAMSTVVTSSASSVLQPTPTRHQPQPQQQSQSASPPRSYEARRAQQQVLSDASTPASESPFQQIHTPSDWNLVDLTVSLQEFAPPASGAAMSSLNSPPTKARYPVSTAASTASFRLSQQQQQQPQQAPTNPYHESPDDEQRRRDQRQTPPASRGDVPRNSSHVSIATTDSSTPSHSLSLSGLQMNSPPKSNGSKSSGGNSSSSTTGIPRPILTSPISESRQSGYDGSPESAGGGRPVRDDTGLSPAWATHFTRAGSSNTPSYSRPPAMTVRSESSGSFLAEHGGGTPNRSASSAASASSNRNTPPTVAVAVPSFHSSHGLMSPPLQRSTSPERIGMLSPDRKRVQPGRGGGTPTAALVRKPSFDRPSEESPTLARQSSRSGNNGGGGILSPDRGYTSGSPHARSGGSGGKSGLQLNVGSSADSIEAPSSIPQPKRSPPGSGGGGAHGTPNFARGAFLGSPVGGLMNFSDGEEEQEDEDEGGIEILETIPYDGGVGNSMQHGRSGSSYAVASPDALRSSREAEESESAAVFRPKLKLKLAATATEDEEEDESTAMSSLERTRGGPAASPRNQNVFGLKLTNLTDSSSVVGGGSMAQSLAGSAGSLANTRNGTNPLPSSSPSLGASLSDSLTSSGRIALANFHASHAKAMQSKRVPQQQHGATRGQSAMRSNASGDGGAGGSGSSSKKGRHRVSESYDVSQHGTLLLDGFEIGQMGIQKTPHVPQHHWRGESNGSTEYGGGSGGEDGRGSRGGSFGGERGGPDEFDGEDNEESDWLEAARRSVGSAGLQQALEAEREKINSAALAGLRISGGSVSSGMFASPSGASSHSSYSQHSSSLLSPPSGGRDSSLSTPGSHPSHGHASGTRRASAIAQKLLTPTPGAGGAHGPVTPGGGLASLGIEFRLSDMVRIGELGSGQNGVVHKALYLPSLRIVALKVCTVFDKDERHQMMKELKSFNACSSPYILSFVGACFMEGRITMALEHMNRGSLDQVVKKQGPLHVSTIRTISKHVLKGLKHMQQRKCIHRDIKPANVLLDNDGRAVLSDFGLVKQLDATNAMASTFVGTMLYLSPERMTGDSFSYPSDVWSWGISVLFLATGALDLPKDYWALLQYVQKPSPGLDREKFPASLCDFVDACLTKDPTLRPSAAELLKHPFILETDPPNTPLHHIWPFSAGKEPDPKELDLLVQAVIDHYYYTPAQIAAGYHLQSPANQLGSGGTPSIGSTPSKSVFTLSRIDVARIQSLAQQLAWDQRALTDEFIRRLTLKGEERDGVKGCANGLAEELFSPTNVIRQSTSFSADKSSSNTSSNSASVATSFDTNSSLGSSRTPSQSHSPVVSGASSSALLQRAKLSRQKSVTLDHDPQFAGAGRQTGDFPFTAGGGVTSLTSSAGGSSLRNSAADRSLSNSLRSTSSSTSIHSTPPKSISTVLHTVSPGRRSDDSSDTNSDADLTPGGKQRGAGSAARSASNQKGGAIAFDPNARVRSFRAADFKESAQQHPASASSASQPSRSSSTRGQPSPRNKMTNQLAQQLESLHESSD